MPQLALTVGQYSTAGVKPVNQDFHGCRQPTDALLASKGIAVALADGISSSTVSQVASQAAVDALLTDYYCTSPAWSVKTSAEKVLAAINSWLHAQTRSSPWRHDAERGYVCTLSALIFKSASAHLFHVGDGRIWQLRETTLEQLSQDHRMPLGGGQSVLARALGASPRLDLDYQRLPLNVGDVFLLTTDGVHEFCDARAMAALLSQHAQDPEHAARAIAEEALRRGSDDNLTVQVVRVDGLPLAEAAEASLQNAELSLPPVLQPRMEFDGYTILRELHASHRSQVWLARDQHSGAHYALKIPSTELRSQPEALERLMMEEWIAQRIDSPHVLKAAPASRKRNYLYVATEYVEGQTLRQWMVDHPRPTLDEARAIIEQVARGLRAFHRMEMQHQDLRPENILIDRSGSVRLIDFGAARVAGLLEGLPPAVQARGQEPLGALAYTAPECFLGEPASVQSDLYSLAVIAHEMLGGGLPYGVQPAKITSRQGLHKLVYQPLRDKLPIPAWVDEAIARAANPEAGKRYQEASEFVYDLQHPNPEFLRRSRASLVERNPVLFWKAACLLLLISLLASLAHGVFAG